MIFASSSIQSQVQDKIQKKDQNQEQNQDKTQLHWTLETLPVLEGGRIKPFDTFAKESLRWIYGKDNFKGQKAIHVILTWSFTEEWRQVSFIRISSSTLKRVLLLDQKKNLFSPDQLQKNSVIISLFEDVRSKKQKNERLGKLDKEIQTLEGKLSLFNSIQQGAWPLLYPSTKSSWLSLNNMSPDILKLALPVLYLSLTNFLENREKENFLKNYKLSFDNNNSVTSISILLNKALQKWVTEVEKKIDLKKIKNLLFWEVHYNNFKPFTWVFAFYVMAFFLLILLVFVFQTQNWCRWLMLSFVFLGFVFQIYGMCLRSYLTGRPPVSNMYESVFWVAFVALLTSLIFYFLDYYRSKKKGLVLSNKYTLMLGASLVVSLVCLLLTNWATVVLNPNLDPLQPVLRDNFWLTVHVLTICGSYGPFFIAFFLGLFNMLWINKLGPGVNSLSLQVNDLIYSCIKVGVILLVIGTILGGIWADYSWGRFWGWDPKETWAFIVILVYLVILHARLVGWIKPFLFSLSSSLAFLFVIMAWYGVNYILGVGLHSYGFGGGGSDMIFLFVSLVFLYVSSMWIWNFFISSKKNIHKTLN